jgi:hypothetical protein
MQTKIFCPAETCAPTQLAGTIKRPREKKTTNQYEILNLLFIVIPSSFGFCGTAEYDLLI